MRGNYLKEARVFMLMLICLLIGIFIGFSYGTFNTFDYCFDKANQFLNITVNQDDIMKWLIHKGFAQ